MAIWRAAALEALIGGQLDSSGLTEEAIQRLVLEQAKEGEQLEFKSKTHLPSTGDPTTAGKGDWKAEQEWAKDVCELANHRGGLLLVGVVEKDEIAVKAKATVFNPSGLEQRLRLALLNYTAPTPTLDIVAIESEDGGHYLAVVVPPSELAPHAVTAGPGQSRKPMQFPVRDGSGTRWMDESEVADRYRRRSLSRTEHDAALGAAVSAGFEQLELTADLWLYLAVNPESLAGSRLDRGAAARINDWHNSYGFASPLTRLLHSNSVGHPAPGRLTFTDRPWREQEEEADPRGGYLELYADGRSFVAKPITFDTADDADKGQVGINTLVDDIAILVDVAVEWARYEVGSWGAADIQAGFIQTGQSLANYDDDVYQPPLTLHRVASDELRRIPGTRLVRQQVRVVVAADLAEADSVQRRLAVTYEVASGLVQHFGLAEVDMIDPDGTLIGFSWGSRLRQLVERWARDHDVAYRNHP